MQVIHFFWYVCTFSREVPCGCNRIKVLVILKVANSYTIYVMKNYLIEYFIVLLPLHSLHDVKIDLLY